MLHAQKAKAIMRGHLVNAKGNCHLPFGPECCFAFEGSVWLVQLGQCVLYLLVENGSRLWASPSVAVEVEHLPAVTSLLAQSH